ncbi:MAG TPA: cytochrome c oxidase assembly protein [Gemmatimonadales bacterium]
MSGLQWWCAATGIPWTWEWRAYPGVWLFVALIAFLYWRLAYGTAERRAGRSAGQLAAAVAGLALIWVALDWPVGALGGGYLASVHTVQYLLLAMIVPVLLVHGLPEEAEAALARRPLLARVGSVMFHPMAAVAIYVGAFLATHAPRVTDALMVTQAGSFVIDAAWLMSGLVFWWPIVGTPPGRRPLAPPFKILQIFLGSLAHTPVAMWLMLSHFPLYATFELAPPFASLTPKMDQQIASGLMILVGGFFVLGAISTIFFRWQGLGEERTTTLREPGPAA